MILDNYFNENNVYNVLDRRNAIECNQINIDIEINSLLGNQNFIIWNKSFTLAVEFNKIGVLRRGQRKNQSLTFIQSKSQQIGHPSFIFLASISQRFFSIFSRIESPVKLI